MTNVTSMIGPPDYPIEFWEKSATFNHKKSYEVYRPDADVILGGIYWTEVYITEEDQEHIPEEYIFQSGKNIVLQTADLIYIAEFVNKLND